MKALDVVILAGGINKISLYKGYTPTYKALLPFAGKPAIAYTLDAVRDLPGLRRVFIVGPEDKLRDAVAASEFPASCTFVPSGDSVMASIWNVLPHLKESVAGDAAPEALFMTADLPLVTTANVRAFLKARAAKKSPYSLNLYLSAVPRRAFTGLFAKSHKGHMVFREGAVYHGNLALIDPRAFEAPGLAKVFERLYRGRKNPIASSLAGGWRIALSYVFGAFLFRLLTMERMARIASRSLGVGIIPVRVNSPEIAIDVDEADDYELVSRELETRAVQP